MDAEAGPRFKASAFSGDIPRNGPVKARSFAFAAPAAACYFFRQSPRIFTAQSD
jgi:hypothetical protein